MHGEFGGDLNSTSNLTLNRVGRKLLGSQYKGALDAISMPVDNGQTQYIILISAVAPKAGHWVGFYRRGGRLYYYDSFGESLDQKRRRRRGREKKKNFQGGKAKDWPGVDVGAPRRCGPRAPPARAAAAPPASRGRKM